MTLGPKLGGTAILRAKLERTIAHVMESGLWGVAGEERGGRNGAG